MTREQAKHLAEVLNAYAEGKSIEVLLDGVWCKVDEDEFRFKMATCIFDCVIKDVDVSHTDMRPLGYRH